MNEYQIRITLKTHHGIFKPTSQSEEFYFCAESRDLAHTLASANVRSQGYPHDEKSIQVLSALPVGVDYWTAKADREHKALMSDIAEARKQNEVTLQSVREATQVVRELTRELGAA